MKKVKIFSGNDNTILQNEINEWLQANKDIEIIASNLSAIGTPVDANSRSEKYIFYLLYAVANEAAKEIAIMMEENHPLVSAITPENLPNATTNQAN